MYTPNQNDVQLDDYGRRAEMDLLNSRIVGLFLESLVCGLFMVTYTIGTWSFLGRDHGVSLSRRNKILLAVNTLMLALAVAHLCLTLQTTLYGFVVKGDTREAADDALSDDSIFFSPVNEAQFYLYVTQTMIGDGFMVYRLFVVWNHRVTIVIVPAILFLIDLVGGYSFATLPGVMVIVFFAFSFFTNALSSGLIMWRVLRLKSSEAQDHWGWHSRAIFNFVRYRRVFEAIIQSAAIYSAASISLLVTMFVSPNIGFYACLSVFPPLIGLVFSLIVIQIGRNSAASAHSRTSVSVIPLSSGGTADCESGYSVVRRESSPGPPPTYTSKVSLPQRTAKGLRAASSADMALVDDDTSRIVHLSAASDV